MSIKTIIVFGSHGAIGSAFVQVLYQRYPNAIIHTFSRTKQTQATINTHHHISDYSNEDTLASVAESIKNTGGADLILVATGILHQDCIQPEKSLKALSAQNLTTIFNINTIVPALIAKHFIPILKRDSQSVFAALSARVGSISDNRLGGWYAYRSSKAALNMILKTAAIETKRRNPKAIIVGIHPGTVDSPLSKPFQINIAPEKLFLPSFSAERLVSVLTQLNLEDSGKCFAWDGQEILP